jgi:hypothetical protein
MDGTTNSKRGAGAGASDEPSSWTNVAILSERIPDDLPPGPKERYLEGVGSDDVSGLDVLTRVRNFFGTILGYGLSGKVRDAYERLCRYHRGGFHIFLFGFSRGAAAARMVAGFVDEVGLLLENQLDLVDEAWRIYVRSADADASDLRDYLRGVDPEYQRPSAENLNQLPIYFLGVWDTVAMWMTQEGVVYDPTSRLIRVPSNVTHARHALAIHEVRCYLPELPWTALHPRPTSTLSLKQVWFPGNHADVGGGGHAPATLARHALDWMVAEACLVGLPVTNPQTMLFDVDPDRRIVHDETHRNTRWIGGAFQGPIVHVRRSLSDWWAFEQPARLATCLDEQYIRWLVDDDHRPVFEAGISPTTHKTMTAAEDAAVRLQLLRAYRGEQAEAPEWIAHETVESVSGCGRVVRQFVSARGNPEPEESSAFVWAVQRWALLMLGEVWREIDRVVRDAAELKEPKDHDELGLFEGTLNRLVATQQALKDACEQLPVSARGDLKGLESLTTEMTGTAAAAWARLGVIKLKAGKRLTLTTSPSKTN